MPISILGITSSSGTELSGISPRRISIISVISARLLALADLAIADAVITAWDSKIHFVFWRPLTAIQEGDNDGNRATAGDPIGNRFSILRPILTTPRAPITLLVR